MKLSRRVQRVEKELRQIIGQYLITGLRDPLAGIVSVSRIQVSPDLRAAKVFIAMMATPDEREKNMVILAERTRDIQQEVHQQLPMKFCPRLSFVLDKGMDNAFKVQKILEELSTKKESS